jgi:hypothetical protein
MIRALLIISILMSGIVRAQETFNLSGELRMRSEGRDNADFNSDRLDGNVQVFNRLRLGFLRQLEHGFLVFVQLQDSRIWGEEGSSLASLNKVDLHQACLQIDHPIGLPFIARLGRQKLAFGSERLVGSFDWDNVGRSFDALHLLLGGDEQRLNLWFAHLRDQSAPTVTRNQEFAGAYFSTQRLIPAAFEAYAFWLYDARNFEPVADPAMPGRQDEPKRTLTLLTVGTRLNGHLGQKFHFDVEGAYQFGERGFRDIDAFGLALSASYTLAERWAPTIHGSYVLGSGDDDPNDGKSKTFSSLFPDVHRYLGAMDYASWSNMSAVRIGATISPREKFSMGADWHLFGRTEENDAWYRAEGFNIGTSQEFYRQPVPTAGRQLGHEIDLQSAFQYRQRLNIALGLSKFFVDEFIKNTGGLRADDSIWAYFSVAMAF